MVVRANCANWRGIFSATVSFRPKLRRRHADLAEAQHDRAKLAKNNGGQRGIRTLDTLAGIHAFQACAFNRSATCPYPRVLALGRARAADYSGAATCCKVEAMLKRPSPQANPRALMLKRAGGAGAARLWIE